jgi:hypothetical protein
MLWIGADVVKAAMSLYDIIQREVEDVAAVGENF